MWASSIVAVVGADSSCLNFDFMLNVIAEAPISEKEADVEAYAPTPFKDAK